MSREGSLPAATHGIPHPLAPPTEHRDIRPRLSNQVGGGAAARLSLSLSPSPPTKRLLRAAQPPAQPRRRATRAPAARGIYFVNSA
eukprot:scaffold153230_cov31-Tisochrysis_lutea.AAC.1